MEILISQMFKPDTQYTLTSMNIYTVKNYADLWIYMVQITRLRYTPRKFALHPEHKALVVVEADHSAVPLAQRKADSAEASTAIAQVYIPSCTAAILVWVHMHGLESKQLWCSNFEPLCCGDK